MTATKTIVLLTTVWWVKESNVDEVKNTLEMSVWWEEQEKMKKGELWGEPKTEDLRRTEGGKSFAPTGRFSGDDNVNQTKATFDALLNDDGHY